MLPSSMLTFISLTHAPSTPLSVLVARATAMLMAFASLNPSLPLIYPVCSPIERMSNIRVRGLQAGQYSRVGQVSSRVKSTILGHYQAQRRTFQRAARFPAAGLISLYSVLLLWAYDQHRAVSVPHDRVGGAAHQRPPHATHAPAAGNDKIRSYLLTQSDDLLVRTPQSQMGSRDGSPSRLDLVHLLFEQPPGFFLDLFVSGEVPTPFRVVDRPYLPYVHHVKLRVHTVGKVHCRPGGGRCLFRAINGQQDPAREVVSLAFTVSHYQHRTVGVAHH